MTYSKRDDKHRRKLATSVSAVLVSCTVPAAWSQDATPVLASPAQSAAENTVLRLLADPAVKAARARAQAQLAATPRGQTAAGAARVPAAIDEWTASVAFQVVAHNQPKPAILWVTDDTPRTWLGHTLPGIGASGDDPDNIYRQAIIDGAGAYEISGQLDPRHRPAQFSLEFDRETSIVPKVEINAASAGMGSLAVMITDRDLTISPDGAFHVTINGRGNGPGHIKLGAGDYSIGLRDTLSDWEQKPTRLSIRRLDKAPTVNIGYAALRSEVVADIGGYIDFWSAFPGKFFGGLAPNAVGGTLFREGGWGFVAGAHYKLEPGEALVVRTTNGGALYTGFQVTDTWMIAPDAKRYQTSLNISQARPSPDGSYTYVIAATDPGVDNWLDTSGIQEGYAVLRWQALPPSIKKDELIKDVKVVRIADLTTTPGVAPISADQRKIALTARADGYANRTR